MQDYRSGLGSRHSAMGNVSTAHDFSAYDVRAKQPTRVRVDSLVDRRRKRNTRRAVIRNVAVCAFVVLMMCGILISNSQLTELTAEVSSLKAKNEELISEQKRLTALYDTQLDLAAIEEIATEKLYMQKLEQSQIVYIRLNGEDVGTVMAGGDSLFARAFDAVGQIVAGMR
ncbi:MAG: cell division protein FtsL [Clostridia bacterium]|nr:cell division protein FtsL [Clostridia bacterium]